MLSITHSLSAHEAAAAGLAHAAGIVSVNVDGACHTFTVVVGPAARGLAVYPDMGASASAVRHSHTVAHGVLPFHEAFAAGLIRPGGPAAAHFNITFGTKFSFVVDTGHG